jgi:hypothetical protein
LLFDFYLNEYSPKVKSYSITILYAKMTRYSKYECHNGTSLLKNLQACLESGVAVVGVVR